MHTKLHVGSENYQKIFVITKAKVEVLDRFIKVE